MRQAPGRKIDFPAHISKSHFALEGPFQQDPYDLDSPVTNSHVLRLASNIRRLGRVVLTIVRRHRLLFGRQIGLLFRMCVLTSRGSSKASVETKPCELEKLRFVLNDING